MTDILSEILSREGHEFFLLKVSRRRMPTDGARGQHLYHEKLQQMLQDMKQQMGQEK